MPADKLCFVQFMHPGVEHRAPRDGFQPWNRSTHRRKFMVGTGQFFDGEALQTGRFTFWGEWEAQSRVVRWLSFPASGDPRQAVEPFYEVPTSYAGLQNTDPFVFGERFHYTGCLQHTRLGPTQLRNLSVGSVILFGSYLRGEFVLDTVFVVKDFVDHGVSDHGGRLSGRISAAYDDVTIKPWYAASRENTHTYRLYFGATFEDRVAEMFSFAPCLPSEDGIPEPFRRPVIEIPGVINPSVKQGKKLNPQPSLEATARLWREVMELVLAQDLALATQIDLPPKHGARTRDARSQEGEPDLLRDSPQLTPKS